MSNTPNSIEPIKEKLDDKIKALNSSRVYKNVIANGLWLWCGWLWREPSVIGLNFAMTIIYVAGTINIFLK